LSRGWWSLIVVGVLTAMGAGYLLLTSTFDLVGDCGEEVIRSVPSPDGRFVATVYRRNCGATSDFATHVNLRRNSGAVKRDGGVVHEGEVLTLGGTRKVKVTWLDSRRLSLLHEPAASFHPVTHWNDVTITTRVDPH
jgi:hypothetical protein